MDEEFYKLNDEHEEDWEPKQESLISKTAKIFIAVLVIGGLLHISGIYQLFLYNTTPFWVSQEKVESIVDAETLTVPVNVFIISGNEALGSARDTENVLNMIDNASNIWNQASIEIKAEKIEELTFSEEKINVFYSNPREFINQIPGIEPDLITVILLKHIRGINGVAFGGARSIAVADYTTSYDFRVFAHEIGHVLGLPHVRDKRGLMYSGSSGTSLSMEEVITARETAERYFSPVD